VTTIDHHQNGEASRRPYRGRYAPTPSGPLHLGNLRTALLAWLLARRAGGAFVLRVEDLDRARVRPGAADAALADLRWLGLDWDEGPDRGGLHAPYIQSERAGRYADALQRLADADLVYLCYCSRADVARAASAPHAGEEGPRYPGTCRDPERRAAQRARAGGRPPALRFRVPTGPEGVVSFEDGLYGTVAQDVAQAVGDFVVRRSDGVPAYHLAVVVDDLAMAIGDMVRGADLLDSTPRQILLYRALHALGVPDPLGPLGHDHRETIPRFLHVPLVVDARGERLAKRHGAVGVGPLRERGIAPEVVVGALASSSGLVPAGTALTARDLLDCFDLASISRVPAPILLDERCTLRL